MDNRTTFNVYSVGCACTRCRAYYRVVILRSMLEIGKRYVATSPDGREYVAVVDEESLPRHVANEKIGHTFEEVELSVPRGGVCISCES